MVIAAPFKDEFSGLQVDLLHDPEEISALPRPTVAGQVRVGLAVARKKGCSFRRYDELVQITLEAVLSGDLGDLLVARVVQLVGTLAVRLDHRALEPAQHLLAAVRPALQIESPQSRVRPGRKREEPHEVAVGVDDHRALLRRAGVAVGEHQVWAEPSGPDVDADRRWAQVRARHEHLRRPLGGGGGHRWQIGDRQVAGEAAHPLRMPLPGGFVHHDDAQSGGSTSGGRAHGQAGQERPPAQGSLGPDPPRCVRSGPIRSGNVRPGNVRPGSRWPGSRWPGSRWPGSLWPRDLWAPGPSRLASLWNFVPRPLGLDRLMACRPAHAATTSELPILLPVRSMAIT